MYKKSWATVSALAFAVAVGTLQMTVVVPLLPGLQAALGVAPTTASWVLTAGLLSGAVAIPLLSRLGDGHGRRVVSLVALALLVVGAVLCAVTDAFPVVVAGRVLQGMSAPLLPLAVGVARDLLPGPRLPAAIGVLSATIGVGSGGGMILAGLVGGDHRTAFWFLAGLGVLAFALVVVVVPADRVRTSAGRPDLLGAALVSGWLVCLLVAVSEGAVWGWTSPATMGLLVAAVVLAAVWVRTARRTAEPLVEIPLLLHRKTVGATVASLLLGFALFATITTFAAHARTALGASVLQVGLHLLPTTVLMLLVSVCAGALMRRFAASTLVAAGSAVVAVAALWLVPLPGDGFGLYAATAVLGLGIGLGYAALGTMAVEHVEPAKTAVAGGINALVRVVGSSLAGAVVAAVLATGGPGGGFAVAAVAAVLAGAFAAVHGGLVRRAEARAAAVV
ncbi:MFS transporter [Saccharothrix obliqua]|uniref:MFS transporter n=1 Tax=Saccharothrix obliqua TaxID=2861747 RepID=UPI001C6061FF|nr:MFS transporter [Saccharothrix obliqua]MBW4720204.1 MFS transporter [Saccharothrix obliqua]